MKLLFITSCFDAAGGGNVIAKRNFTVLENVLGKENVTKYVVTKSRFKICDFLYRLKKHYVGGLTLNNISDIVRLSGDYDVIWIDGSFFGALAKCLKEFGYKGRIVCFFHNIERNFTKVTWRNIFAYPIKIRPIYKAEHDAIFYSDDIVTLTPRDMNFVKETNKFAQIHILPSSLNDSFRELPLDTNFSKVFTLLFVGSYFYANVHGIEWFIANVLPFVEAKLIVVGAGMEKLKYTPSSKLEIHGFVEDLGYYYRNSDVVVAPIFEGSGMKTKTAEALMWGKYVIGTKEAFCGFINSDEWGVICCTADDFIQQIKIISSAQKDKFNRYSRKIFLEKYSLENSERIIKSIFNCNAKS